MICPVCGRPMFEVDGCIARPGVLVRTEELDWLVFRFADWIEVELPERCRDCYAALAGFHHPGCCVALCTVHDGEQRFLCGCDD
jgi:hypothetical protein